MVAKTLGAGMGMGDEATISFINNMGKISTSLGELGKQFATVNDNKEKFLDFSSIKGMNYQIQDAIAKSQRFTEFAGAWGQKIITMMTGPAIGMDQKKLDVITGLWIRRYTICDTCCFTSHNIKKSFRYECT